MNSLVIIAVPVYYIADFKLRRNKKLRQIHHISLIPRLLRYINVPS